MKTLQQFSELLESIPASTTWYLTDLAEARGKQQLYLQQVPQRLNALREHAIIESAVSSNRIEGVQIDPGRVRAVVLGKTHLHDRDEEEVRGYRQALKVIHEQGAKLSISEETICELHRVARAQIWDSGQYKQKESDIIEKYPNGRVQVRFQTVKASETKTCMKELIRLWHSSIEERRVHPLIALAGFNLDFLCIHPFRDGNGRVSRLLLMLQLYHLGFEVGRYISLERLIEQNKDRYYETLAQSSSGWHEQRHNPWVYINYLFFILRTACREFEDRLGQLKIPRGAKTEIVQQAIAQIPDEFSLTDLERACPGVSRDMIRRVLRQLKKDGRVECLGRGPGALWRKKEVITPK